MNVMLLDDDPFVLSMLKAAFEKHGHKVIPYSNPDRCPAYCSLLCPCTLLKNGCPDAILSDVNMPLVNGVKFIQELKRKGCTCSKIGLMSGDWSEVDIQTAVRLDATIFFKPFDLKSLLSWITPDVRHAV